MFDVGKLFIIIGPISRAHRTPADAHFQRILFKRLWTGFSEHVSVFDGRQPIRIRRGEEVATSQSVTFDKRPRSKVFQTRSGTDQRLATTLSTGIGMLKNITKSKILSIISKCLHWCFTMTEVTMMFYAFFFFFLSNCRF